MTIKFGIIGMQQIGASIGLALAQIKDQVTRTGNDEDPGVARKAEKIGAIDKVAFTIPDTVRNADVIILAVPADEVRFTLESIAPDLKPGAVVIDTSPVKEQAMKWANEFFTGEDRYFLSVSLSLNPANLLDLSSGTEHGDPKADLFQNSYMIISCLPGTDESALTLTTNLAQVIGAMPLFADAVEIDGLLASVQILPEMIAAALVNTTVSQPGWREARRLAGPAYALMTELAQHADPGREPGTAALLNPENTVRLLDQFMNELTDLRDAIANQDATTLQQHLVQAREGRALWFKQRSTGDWEPKLPNNVRLPTGSDVFGRMFGIRPKKDKNS